MSKYAVCVGINDYPGAPLSGCINDAMDWGHVLLNTGYTVNHLIDETASLMNIKRALREMVARATYRDRIVFTFSGHGTFGSDASGDEADGRDEAICPHDCFTNGMLYDDEINDILSMRRYGVRALIISDSCHSGTVNRFLGHDTIGKPKFLPSRAMPIRANPASGRGVIGKGNVLLAGSLDHEYAYDAWFGRRPNGAFTRAAIDALGHNPKTYRDWHAMIRAELPNTDYPQTPQLDASYYRSRWVPLA